MPSTTYLCIYITCIVVGVVWTLGGYTLFNQVMNNSDDNIPTYRYRMALLILWCGPIVWFFVIGEIISQWVNEPRSPR